MKKEEKKQFDNDKSIVVIQESSPGLCKSALNFEIKTSQNQDAAFETLAVIKDALKGIKKIQTEYSAPVKKMIKDLIDTPAKLLSAPLIEAKDILVEKLRLYERDLQEIKEAAEEKHRLKIEKAAENNKPLPVPTTPAPIVEKQVKTETSTNTYIDNWTAEVTDKKAFIEYAFSVNQMDLIDINSRELKSLAKSVKNSRAIPGIVIENKKIISQRRS